jgi:hypothetical protein
VWYKRNKPGISIKDNYGDGKDDDDDKNSMTHILISETDFMT